MRIGFFDSGIGGISVLAEALSLLPDQEYIYCADTENAPYGVRETDEIARFAEDNARFLLEKHVDAIVVACNTATAAAIGRLREISPVPVVGMEPAVKPAVEIAVKTTGMTDKAAAVDTPTATGAESGRVLVTATPLTLREAKLKDLIQRVDLYHRVDLLPLPGLVPLAERGDFDSDEVRTYLDSAFSDVNPSRYAALVMGCTHFVFFAPSFSEIMGKNTLLVDGNEGTVRRLADVLGLMTAERRSDPCAEDVFSGVSWYESGAAVRDVEKIARYRTLCGRIADLRGIGA